MYVKAQSVKFIGHVPYTISISCFNSGF